MKEGAGAQDSSLPSHTLDGFLFGSSVWGCVGMDQHSLSRGIVRSYTWGETQLLLFLLVHYIPLLASRKKKVVFPSFTKIRFFM